MLRDKFILEREDGSEIYFYTNFQYQKTLYILHYHLLVLIELKRRGLDLKEAFNQINRYKKHSYQGLYRYLQIFVVSNGVDTKYFANI